MTFSSIGRLVVSLATAAFATVACIIWVAPERAARLLGFDAIAPNAMASIRTELGGLFLGLAVLCGLAARTRGRAWALSGASMVGAIALARLVSWAVSGGAVLDVPALVIELVVLAALVVMVRDDQSSVASRPRHRLVISALLIVPVTGAVALMNPSLQLRLFDAAARRIAATVNTAPLEDDALRVAVCGSSAPLPSAARAKACVAVFAGGRFYIVDAGPESVENLVLWGVPLSSIGGVLLTHFHSDHIGDLGELNLQTWAAGRQAALDVYGGPGVDGVVAGFNDAYRLDQGYRTKHHGEHVMRPATWPMIAHTVALDGEPTAELGRTAVVLDDGALRITAIEVDHTPIAPAYAYRFDYRGRSVLVTGDLKYRPSLTAAARGVDVLVSEAIAVQMTRALGEGARAGGRNAASAIMHDIEDYHITPEQAATVANEAQAKLLVFYHLLPAPDGFLPRRVFAQGLDRIRPDGWALADDGSLYTMPIGSRDVRTGRVTE